MLLIARLRQKYITIHPRIHHEDVKYQLILFFETIWDKTQAKVNHWEQNLSKMQTVKPLDSILEM